MPRSRSISATEWRALVHDWDGLFLRYDPGRAEKFDLILDLLSSRRLSKFTLLDLGCGPGVLGGKVLQRFPRAKVIGVDMGPKVLRMAEEAWKPYRDRTQWIRAELQDPGWRTLIPPGSVGVVVSSLCLHALAPRDLRRLYQDLGRMVRRDGLLIDADLIPWEAHQSTFNQLSESIRELEVARGARGNARSLSREGEALWRRVRRRGLMADLFAAQDAERRAAKERHPSQGHKLEDLVGIDTHLSYLRSSGFREVSVIWQHLDRRVLVAVR